MIQHIEHEFGAQDWSDDDAVEELQKPPQRTSSRKRENTARSEKLLDAISNIATRRYCVSQQWHVNEKSALREGN